MRAVLFALVLLAAPSPAFAEGTSAVGVVRAVCLPNAGDTNAILAEISADGWRQLSDHERRQRDPENVAGGFVMHWASSQAWAPADDSVQMLIVGEGPLGQGEARANFCAVMQQLPFSRQVRSVRDWLGFDRFQTWGPGGDNFAYVRDAGGNLTNGASVADDVRDAALREGRFGFIQVVGDRTTSVVNFSALQPVEPPVSGDTR